MAFFWTSIFLDFSHPCASKAWNSRTLLVCSFSCFSVMRIIITKSQKSTSFFLRKDWHGTCGPPRAKKARGIFIVLYAPALTPCLGNLLHCTFLVNEIPHGGIRWRSITSDGVFNHVSVCPSVTRLKFREAQPSDLHFPPFGSTSFLWHLRLGRSSVLATLSRPLSGVS